MASKSSQTSNFSKEEKLQEYATNLFRKIDRTMS